MVPAEFLFILVYKHLGYAAITVMQYAATFPGPNGTQATVLGSHWVPTSHIVSYLDSIFRKQYISIQIRHIYQSLN